MADHDPRRLWTIKDNETHHVMAPTAEQALAFWRSEICGDPDEPEPDIYDVTSRAEMMIIRSDDDAGGPPKNARMYMDEEDAEVAMIGSSVW